MTIYSERVKIFEVNDEGEGGLVFDRDRVNMINKPTLMIGLGGTGIDALLRTKYEIYRRVRPSANSDQPTQLAYLAIDTDASSLPKIFLRRFPQKFRKK